MQLPPLLNAIAHSAPALIALFLAAVLGLINLGRYKTPALLTMLGGLLGGLTLFASVLVREMIWANATADGKFEAAGTLTAVIGIGGNVIVAVGIGMIAFAVFAGRRPTVRDDRDRRDDRPRDREPDDRPRRDGGEPLKRASRPPG